MSSRCEIVLGTVLVILVVEACRRALSRWMAVTICIALFYLATSPYWPGLLKFKGYAYPRMIEVLYLASDEGMFGFLTGISSSILFIYILFAGFMLHAGVGGFLIDFAVWAAGWTKGGPAKIAVISSALYGTVSGSTVANVYATGSFTIPLMKKGGFIPKQAAAIEAIAGTGGQIMPPIMGAGAFIMSEITGIPYFRIIQAAAIPAVLYYLGLFFVVHFISIKQGMSSIPEGRPARYLPHAPPLLLFPPLSLNPRLPGIRIFSEQIGLFRGPHHLRSQLSGPNNDDDPKEGDGYPLRVSGQCRHYCNGPCRIRNDRGSS